MKLHLPKRLFTALLAAISFIAPAALTLGSAAWGADGWEYRSSEHGYRYNIGTPGDVMHQTIDATTSFTYKGTDYTPGDTYRIWSDNANDSSVDQNLTVNTLLMKNNDSVIIETGEWGSKKAFNVMTIESLQVADSGKAKVTIGDGNTVNIKAVTGTLSSVTNNNGTLTLGTEDSTINLSGTVTNTGTMTLNGNISLDSAIKGAGSVTVTGALTLTDYNNLYNISYTYAGNNATSGFRAGFTGSLTEDGTLTFADGATLAISNLGTGGSCSLGDNGTVTGTLVGSTIYDVNEDMTYAAATHGSASDVYVNSGTLTIGDTTNAAETTSNVPVSQKLVLNGGNIKWAALPTTIAGIKVIDNSDFTIYYTSAGSNTPSSLTLNSVDIAAGKTLTINKTGNESWKQALIIAALTGEGTLNVNGPGGGAGAASSHNITLSNFKGNISVTSREYISNNANKDIFHATINTGESGVNMGTLTIAGFGQDNEQSTFTFNVQGDSSLQSIALTDAATVSVSENKGLTVSTLTGTGTLTKTAAGTLNLYSADSTADIHVNGGTLYTEGTKTLGSGDIYVNSGGTLKLGDNGGDTVVFSDNQRLILNGGNVVWGAQGSTIYDVDVTATSDFSIYDMLNGTTELVIKSLDIAESTTLSINSNSSTNRWKHWLNVEALTGDGTLSVQGPVSAESLTSTFKIGSLKDFTGHVNVTSNEGSDAKKYNATISTGSEDVDFKSLTFTGYGESGEASTATFNVEGNTNIETLLAAGATVNISAGKTLTIDGTGASVQNSIGTLSSAGNLTYTSSGSMSIGTLSMSGDANLTVSSGAGTLNLTDSVTIAAESNATLTGSMGLGNTIVNNGTLALNGSTFELLNELATGKYTMKSEGNAGYTHGGSNGFYNANGAEYYLTYGGALAEGTDAELITVKNGETTYDVGIDDAGQVYFGTSSAEGTTFYISSGEVTVSSSDAARALAYELSADTTMNLSGGAATNADVTINAAGDSTINLAAGSTLNTFTKEGSGTITLTGSGTYDLGSNTSTNVSGLTAEAWTGTVTLSAIPAAGLNVNNFGNAASKVKLDGVSGWFARAKFNPHIVLGDNGLTFTDYSEDKAYNFANGISGTGYFVVSAETNQVTATPFIAIGSNSDTSLKWSGKFKVDNVHSTVTLLLNGGGTYFDAESDAGIEMNDADNTLYLYVGYATDDSGTSKNISAYDTTGATLTTINGAISNNSGGTLELTVLNDTVFNKEVAVTSMTVNSGKTATLNATLKAGDVTNNGELKLGTAATVTGGTMGNVQMSSTGIDTTATDGSNGSIDNALVQLARDASFTIEDMTLTGTTSISATEGTAKVTLSNVTATSHLKLNATAANSFVAAGGDESGSISYSYGLGLGSAEAETNSITLNLNVTDIVQPTESGLYTLTVTLSNFAGSGFDGLDVDAWKALVGFDQESWLGQALVDATFTTEAVPPAETGEAAPTVSYGYAAGDGGSNVGTLTITITGLNVPEPASATLGLAALMMLCARRRRKA